MQDNEPTTQAEQAGQAEEATANSPSGGSAAAPVRPCPYCGHLGENDGVQEQCSKCKGWFEPLSRQASQNSMGPWFFHDDAAPFRPGCSYETLRKLILKGRVTGETIIRGPGTNQFWVYARNAPGVAHLLGVCHNCGRRAGESSFLCEHCGAAFPAFEDRQQLGLAPVRLLPGQAHASHVAASAMSADPGDSDFGPVAPTFAIAAVEQATASAAANNTNVSSAGSQETVDALPEAAPAVSMRRDRRYGRMKMAVVGMVVVVVALLIVVIAMVMQSGAGAAGAGQSAPVEAAAVSADPGPTLVQPDFTNWSNRLAEADSLIATDEAAKMESGLAILRDVQANAPAGALPAGLDERIDHLAETIESAMLRNYLGQDG